MIFNAVTFYKKYILSQMGITLSNTSLVTTINPILVDYNQFFTAIKYDKYTNRTTLISGD